MLGFDELTQVNKQVDLPFCEPVLEELLKGKLRSVPKLTQHELVGRLHKPEVTLRMEVETCLGHVRSHVLRVLK